MSDQKQFFETQWGNVPQELLNRFLEEDAKTETGWNTITQELLDRFFEKSKNRKENENN
jgi:hypothetical protein